MGDQGHAAQRRTVEARSAIADAEMRTMLGAARVEQLEEECDGFLPSVCAALVRERMRELVGPLDDDGDATEVRRQRVELLAADWQVVVRAFDRKCAFCGATGALERDRIVAAEPLSKLNVVPACRRCVRSRRGRYVAEWLATRLDFEPAVVYARMARARAALLSEARLARVA